MLKIHEITTSQGCLSPISLQTTQGTLQIVDDEGPLDLPAGALEAVMARYGAPFDPQAPIDRVATLDLGNGDRLSHVRHIAGYDVIGRDYLVLEFREREPLCAMSAVVAGALAHLARAERRQSRVC
jgi:hypothetical protein